MFLRFPARKPMFPFAEPYVSRSETLRFSHKKPTKVPEKATSSSRRFYFIGFPNALQR